MRNNDMSVAMVVRRVLARYWFPIVGIAIVSVLWAIEDSVVRPYLLKWFMEAMEIHAPVSQLFFLVAMYGAIRCCMILLVRCADWFQLIVVPGAKACTVSLLTDQLIDAPVPAVQQAMSGSLAGSIAVAAEGIPQLITPVVGRFLGSMSRVTLAIGSLWFTLPAAAIALAVWVVCFIGGGMWWASRIRMLSHVASRKQTSVQGTIVDVIANLVSVVICGQERAELDRVRDAVSVWIDAERVRDWSLLWLYAVQGVSFLLLELCMLVLIVYGYQQGMVTVGDVGLVITINMVLIEALWDIPQEMAQCVRAMGRASQGIAQVASVSRTTPCERAVVACRVASYDLALERVSFAYDEHQGRVVEALSLAIPQGQRIGVVGVAGSGKSTLVHLISGLMKPSHGKLLLGGIDYELLGAACVHRLIAYIPQQAQLFHRTILENIRYGSPSASDEAVVAAAQAIGIDTWIRQFPNGYETVVGERGMRLSGGQRQLILLARLALMDRPIVILDEATSALDSLTEQQLQNGLAKIAEGRTLIVIAHRLSTIHALDRIIVLDHGKIVQDGMHAELMLQDGVYKQLWHAHLCSL